MAMSSSSNAGGAGDAGECEYTYTEEFITNTRGMRLFTCRWLPRKAKAAVCMCHGYAVECSVTMRVTGERLARAGYAVYGVDYEGHGKSDGLQGYVASFDALVGDVDAFFYQVASPASHARRFLLGESMGGAVALLLHRARPEFWSGAVLVAPMCKIADSMRPHPVVVSILKTMSTVIPKWKVVPTNDVIDMAYRLQEKRDEVRRNPYCYKGKPRLMTACEMLRVSLDIEATLLPKVSLPFLIVHGGDDKVTDPSVSDLLYKSAASSDKTFKLYPGMWHALTSGETPANIDTVFRDIVTWLNQRSSESEVLLLSETEQKAKHDDQHSDKLPA